MREPLEAPSRRCRVTLATRLSEAAPACAWHDVVVLADSSADVARELRAGMAARAPLVPLVVVLPVASPRAADFDGGADAVLVRDDGGVWRGTLPAVVGLLAARHADRLAREHAEAELRRQRELFDGFMRHSPAVAYLKDAEGRYAWVNATFERFFDVSEDEWRDRTDADIWGEEAGARLRENDRAVLQEGEAIEVEDSVPMEDGIHHWLAFKFPWRDAEGSPQVGGMAVDVTEIRRAEEERRLAAARSAQAHRLESLGSLASNIAHDFNNILVSILGNAELAALECPEGSDAATFLEEIESSALRAADLTHQLLAVTGRASLLVESLDLGRFVESRSFAMRAALPRAMRLHLESAPGTPGVMADAAQLEHVLTTLLERAGRAESATRVTIRVSCDVLGVDDLSALLFGESLIPGLHVLLDVEDDGVSPSEEALSLLFEPEFEPASGGSPMGMAAVLGLVRGHGAAIGATPLAEAGTRVRIVLPPAPLAAADEAIPTPPSAGGGTVLVVDDEETVRSIARAALQRFGWNVLVARDGKEAIAIFREMGDQVSAVLLDLTMPGASGLDVLRQLRAIDPSVKIVLSSGYPEGDAHLAAGADAFLAKPYRSAKLLDTIRSVVEGDDT